MLQGFFEWLPVSSTGELMLVMISFFDYSIEHASDVSFFLHIGTVISAIIYLRKDVKSVLSGLKNYKIGFDSNSNVLNFLIISTIISGGLGFIIYIVIKEFSFSGEVFFGFVGIALIITGILQKIMKTRGVKVQSDVQTKDSILLGIIQAFSVIPGISRSGLTMSAFLLRGYSGESSIRLSFLMGIPAIIIAEIGLIGINGLPDLSLEQMGIGLATSFVFGLISISIMLRIAKMSKIWLVPIIVGSISLISFLSII